MARRFGRFNKNQKRDRKGRWTKGGGASASKSKAKVKPNYRTGQLSNGAILMTTKDPNRYGKIGSKAGGAAGLVLGALGGQPLAGAGVGILAGGLVGNTIDQRVARVRVNRAEAVLRRKR